MFHQIPVLINSQNGGKLHLPNQVTSDTTIHLESELEKLCKLYQTLWKNVTSTHARWNRCAMLNSKRTPDVAVVLIPKSCKSHLKVPVFFFEVLRKKEHFRENGTTIPWLHGCMPVSCLPAVYLLWRSHKKCIPSSF